MSKPSVGLRLFSHGAVYTGGILLMRAGNFLLLPVYTALLTTAEFGTVGVLKQAVQVLVLLALCGQELSMLRLGIQKDSNDEQRGVLAGTLLTFVMVLGLVVSCIAALCWPLYQSYLDDIPLLPLGAVALSWVATTAVFRLILSNLQQRERPQEHTKLNLLRWFFLLGFVGLFVIWTPGREALGELLGAEKDRQGALGLLLATSLSFLFGAMIGLRYLPQGVRFGINRPVLRSGLAYGLPVVPHALAAAVLASADRIILADQKDLAAVGVYTLAANLASIVVMVSSGLHRAWSPFFLRVDAQGDSPDWSHVRRLSFFSLSGVGAVTLAVGLGSPLLISLAANERYAKGSYATAEFPTAILAFALFVSAYYLIASAVVFAEQKSVRWIALITVPAMLLNVVLNLLWVPDHGLQGAAYATLISSAVMALGAGVLGRRTRKVPFKYARAAVLLVVVGGALWLGVGASWSVKLALLAGYVVVLLLLDGRDLMGAGRSVWRQLQGLRGR
jgi:O-antigen/teichoic acid export membrane protein